MTFSDLWPRFQGHNIIQHQMSRKWYKIAPWSDTETALADAAFYTTCAHWFCPSVCLSVHLSVCCQMHTQQELSYRKHIARMLCTQYVEVTHRPKYYTVTAWLWNLGQVSLKVTGNGTIGQIIHDLLLVELLDVKYYRDLEMWVRGHSRYLKMVHLKAWVQFPIRLP